MKLLDGQPSPLIIAEIGPKYTHLETMKEMVTAAKQNGADMVKFQTFRAETVATPGSTFTLENGEQVSQFDFFKQAELSYEDHVALNRHCEELGIPWISTPSHTTDVDMLEKFDPVAYKTGSDDLTNLPFLKYLGETGRPIIVSTGMCTLGEIERAVETLLNTGNNQLVLLHCVVSYPSRPEDANLNTIKTLQNAFGLPVGLSDHTTDGFTSILATALGAVIIEKHFCMDYKLDLPDSQAALDSDGLKDMVKHVRMVSLALGSGVKRILPTEQKWRSASRKSIFSAHDLPVGHLITEQDLTIRRPSDGIHPHHLELVVGRTTKVDIPANSLITWDMV